MTKWLGEWVFNFHIWDGIIAYILIFLHPLLLVFFNHFAGVGWDPYAVFINACLLCKTPMEYYYTLGMIAFWLLTLTVFMGIYRNYNLWFKRNWRKFHVFNYVVFLVVGLHGFLIGTDFKVQPFYSFAILASLTVTGIIIFVEIPRLYRNYISWLHS